MKKKLVFKAPVTTASGYGVHSRQLLAAMLGSGEFDVSVKLLNWGNTSFIVSGDPLVDEANRLAAKWHTEQQRGVKYDVSVQVTIPNEFERMADFNVGVTAGIEVNVASPEWIARINRDVDMLVVPSKHSRDVLLASKFVDQNNNVLELNKEPIVVHEGFIEEFFNTEPYEQRDALRLLDDAPEFNFLTVGIGFRGFGKERKNLSNTIRWFCEAFKGRRDVGLIVKGGLVNGSYIDFTETRRIVGEIKSVAGCGEFPRVTVLHGRLSDSDMGMLYRHPRVKALLALTCGEGFGLPILEAAACGLPVIATAWSGHLDFLFADGKPLFVPVEYDMVPVPDEAVWPGVIEKGTSWAMPREADAKDKMRRVVLSYDKPLEWATDLIGHVHKNFSLDSSCNRFVDVLMKGIGAHSLRNPRSEAELVDVVRARFGPDDAGKKLIYTMPMSAGDVFLSTGIVRALKKKHPEHKIFFATQDRYASILIGNPDIHKVIPYEDWMMNVRILEGVFDEVYTPNVGIQMTFSNWVHGGKGRNIFEEMAVQCHLDWWDARDCSISKEEPQDITLPQKFVAFHPGSGKGQWGARNYLQWQDVINNFTGTDCVFVQVGTLDEPAYKGCVDLRGKTPDYRHLAWVLSKCDAFVGIDSVSMHIAAALGKDVVALFGSSYPRSTGPLPRDEDQHLKLLETPSRYTCNRACYQYTCKVAADNPCINEIKPQDVFYELMKIVRPDEAESGMLEFRESRPMISGYTHVFNAKSGGYPFVESIRSMLGFCDEVVVVDGGSDDGTREAIEAIGDPRINVYVNKWDWSEPGMDGMQKAFGRALCSGDFLWQQDVDEVVHEDDYEKIVRLCKRFPKDVDLLHLPVVELWGDCETVRTDRHSWKWRLSRSNFRITHGINRDARVADEKTGKVYAKRGMSDGCEYVDIMTHEYLPHRGFYDESLERLRVTDPAAYGARMNAIFSELPSVFHYSWADLPRKVRNFKQTWDRMWTNLYRDEKPHDRFPEVKDENDIEMITSVAEELKKRGGERKAPTFNLLRSNPAVMVDWIENASHS